MRNAQAMETVLKRQSSICESVTIGRGRGAPFVQKGKKDAPGVFGLVIFFSLVSKKTKRKEKKQEEEKKR